MILRLPGIRRRCENGFTLLEMLIVVAIIAVLATLIGPRLFGQLESSKATTAKAQVRLLRTSLDTLRLDLGRYPTEQEGLDLLVTPPGDSTLAGSWFGPYLDGSVPNDPWGNRYHYRPPETSRGVAVVYSLGADNAEGGDGPDADIYSAQ